MTDPTPTLGERDYRFEPVAPFRNESPQKRPVEQGITKEDAIQGGVFHVTATCSSSHVERWRSNGKCKTWKTRPDEFRLPVKHGLYRYGYITEKDVFEFHRAEDCPHDHH